MDTIKFMTQITNPCGEGPTLEEYAKKVLKKNAAGEASPEDSDGKKCGDGQVISDKGEAGEGFQDGESVKGKSEDDKKAEAPVKETAEKKEDEKPEEKKEDKKASTEKKAAGKAKAEGCEGEGIPISLDADKEFQKGESVDGSKVTPKTKKTEASVKEEWVKISNLNPKQKAFLTKYWSTLYPREFVDAMVQPR